MTRPPVVARPLEGDRFEVTIRGHVLVVDQPAPLGDDEGPTPVELFVASLVACVGVLARRYLVRHSLPTAGLRVSAEHDLPERPSRVTAVRVTITPPDGLSPARRRGLLAVASHCTVHNSLQVPPDVDVVVSAANPGGDA